MVYPEMDEPRSERVGMNSYIASPTMITTVVIVTLIVGFKVSARKAGQVTEDRSAERT